ncbi:hypothetical protein TcarDRAFT_0911 [Thermosinus carboxydivorans Nor1]|uniref:Uncharacterized protein n=1 Tax=Thermosinus carboxydivorans Nor1 TaxID=401526 RepID=A1HSM8_9FIRM|nr:hypothetical protein TcarDRAFT_0911 [Thermosinus carboxydivorans Nor1]
MILSVFMVGHRGAIFIVLKFKKYPLRVLCGFIYHPFLSSDFQGSTPRTRKLRKVVFWRDMRRAQYANCVLSGLCGFAKKTRQRLCFLATFLW